MKAKVITNPYIVYSLAFLLVMTLYPLHWSELYPDLSIRLIIFLVCTILVSLIAGLLLHKTNYFSYNKVNYSNRRLWLFTILIILSYIAEFAYMRTVPVFTISTGGDYDYTTFGIPTFHVIVVTFNSFWAVFVFHNIVSKKNKALILQYFLCLLPSILIFNRGMFLIIIISSLFVLLMAAGKVIKLIFKILFFLLVILFLFGIAGNVRISGNVSADDVILGLGHSTKKFDNSPVPNQFFWGYLYTTSSLGNLQETINDHHIGDFTFEKVALFINSEIFPDFISKRNKFLFKHIEPIDQISASFTVGTVYARSYAYFGWFGMAMMYVYIFVFNFLIIIFLNKRSQFFISGIAILNCIMFFNIFDNMFTFSGTVLQLTYPIIFGALPRIKIVNKFKGYPEFSNSNIGGLDM